MKRTLIGISAIAIVVAVASRWFTHAEEPKAPVRLETVRTSSPFSPGVNASVVRDRSPEHALEPHTDSLADYATGKYSFLFDDMFVTAAAGDELRAALLNRERIAVALNTARQSHADDARQRIAEHESALADADRSVRALLHPTDYAVYEALKDSDIEQYQLDQYADGIGNVAPLSDADRRAILLTKLNYKRQFRQTLLDSGILRPELTPSQRQQAFAGVRMALEQYRDSYLAEVRQYLYDDEQYALLHNYESSEFAAEIDKLRSIAGGG